jgi:hypothetical protein
MPNHVDTHLTITGTKKDLDAFEKKHLIEKESEDWEGKKTGETFVDFDFNTIIPMPESLNITSGSNTDQAVAVIKAEAGDTSGIQHYKSYPWVVEELGENASDKKVIAFLKKKLDKKAMKEGRMSIENKEKYGYENWYDWKCSVWGTKWGAYDAQIDRVADDCLVIDYNTAWSPATPIFDKLNEMYPNLVFEQQVLDEGMGFGGTQRWDEDGYSEEFHEGDSLYQFCNEYYDRGYGQCPECGEWYDTDWVEEGHDENLCYECNEKKTDEVE